MKEYVIPKELKTFIEKMKKPFVLSQQTSKGPVAVAVSNGFCEMFGYADREQINSDIDHNMFKNVHPQDTARISNEILRFSAEGSELNVLYRSMKKHGSGYRWVRMTGEYADTEDGVRLCLMWFSDEGDYEEKNNMDLNSSFGKAILEESTNDALHYDYLTGLPNLSYFFELAEVARKIMLEQGKASALLYIDLT